MYVLHFLHDNYYVVCLPFDRKERSGKFVAVELIEFIVYGLTGEQSLIELGVHLRQGKLGKVAAAAYELDGT